MIPETDYLQHIQSTFPHLELRDLEVNREGMVNVSVIVNRERVFRFPREEWGIDLLRNEMNVLRLIRTYTNLPVPDWDYYTDEMVSYPYITGDALLPDDVLRMGEKEKDAVAQKLGHFLKRVHTIPMAEVREAGIQVSDTARTRENWLQLYEDIQEKLFPLMWADGREWVRRHFAPLLADAAFMEHEPIMMMGDLAPYHLLYDFSSRRFTGIIDFGTAGIGDPAADFCTIINQYGESFLRRMAGVYPEIGEHIVRSRFWAGTLELQWIRRGLERGDNSMFVVHIGRARDVQALDAPW